MRYICLLGLMTLCAQLQAQAPTLRITVDSTLVSLEAIVQDTNARPITNLTRADFSIYEDGELQPLSYFASSHGPRSVLLLMDIMVADEPLMLDAATAFLGTLRSQDRLLIAAFDRDLRIALNWQPTRIGLLRDVRMPAFPLRAEMQATTRMYGSLEEATRLFRNETGLKEIVVITNGRDSELDRQMLRLGEPLGIPDDRDFNKHLETLKRAQIPIYFVAMGTDRNGGILHPAWYPDHKMKNAFLAGVRVRMEKLAEATGGQISFPRNVGDVVPMYRKLGIDLGISYKLGYTPHNSVPNKKPRHIEVRVRAESLHVWQSRTEYSIP